MIDTHPLKRLSGTSREYDQVIKTVCRECSAGCGLLAFLKDGAIVDIQGSESHPLSRGRLCARGIAFIQGIDHQDRLGRIEQRKSLEDSFLPLDDREKALDYLGEQLRRIRSWYGPRSLVIGCDPEAGLDFYLGALRFAHLWGTPHVFHPLYAPGGIQTQAEPEAYVQPCNEWIKSRCIFLIEADLATTHPVAFGWVLEAQARGAKVVVADSRFTPTMSKADAAFNIKPESGNKLGLALMKILFDEGLCSKDAPDPALMNKDRFKRGFEEMSLDSLEDITGLSLDKAREIARLLAKRQSVTLVAGARLVHRQNRSIWPIMASAMDWSASSGGGWYPVDRALPPLSLYEDIDARASLKKSSESSDSEPEESDEPAPDAENPVKAIICTGNCLYDYLSPLRKSVEGAELITYFGSFPNDTYKLSHVAIPATQWAESEGLCFSSDRAVQWAPKIVEPKEGCFNGLDFWTGLAQRFADVKHLEWKAFFPWKKEDGRADLSSFSKWVLGLSPCMREIGAIDPTGEASELGFWSFSGTIQGEAGAGGAAASGEKPEPLSLSPILSPIPPTGDERLFPLFFHTSRVVSRSGDAGSWWLWTKDLEDPGSVRIHPETARALGMENGEKILIEGADGAFEATARLSRMVPRRMVWSPKRIGGNRALVRKSSQTSEEARQILLEFLEQPAI